jgi:hypothetical protein
MTCYLYVISEGSDGPVKVGFSAKPRARLTGLQSGNPRRLTLEEEWLLSKRRHAEIIERDLHDLLANYSMVGEWFDLPPNKALALVWGRLQEKFGF